MPMLPRWSSGKQTKKEDGEKKATAKQGTDHLKSEEEYEWKEMHSGEIEDVDKYITEYNTWQLHLAKNDRQNTLQRQHADLSQPVYYPPLDKESGTSRTQLEKQRQEAKRLKMAITKEECPGYLASMDPYSDAAISAGRRNSTASSLLALSETSGMSLELELESMAKKQLFEYLLAQTKVKDVSTISSKDELFASS